MNLFKHQVLENTRDACIFFLPSMVRFLLVLAWVVIQDHQLHGRTCHGYGLIWDRLPVKMLVWLALTLGSQKVFTLVPYTPSSHLRSTLMAYIPSSCLYLMLRQGNQVRLSLFFCL